MQNKENNTTWNWFSFYDNDNFIANIYFLKIEDRYFTFSIRSVKPSIQGILKINPFSLEDFSYEADVPKKSSNKKYYLSYFEETVGFIQKDKFETLIKSPVWETAMQEFLKKKGLIWAI